MKRDLGFGRCGLACCLCSENETCPGCGADGCPEGAQCENRICSMSRGLDGCHACPALCRRGLLAKGKPYGFSLFIQRYGADELLDCLERNERLGVVYHREGITGNYDGFQDAESLIAFIRDPEGYKLYSKIT